MRFILICAVLILIFFTLYKLLWRKDISEPYTMTNFKDVLGSLVVRLGIRGISGLGKFGSYRRTASDPVQEWGHSADDQDLHRDHARALPDTGGH